MGTHSTGVSVSQTFVSLNSRLESNEKHEATFRALLSVYTVGLNMGTLRPGMRVS